MEPTYFLFLIFALPLVNGFCYTSQGRVDKTVTGRMVPVCQYNGLDLLDGSQFRTANCMDCKCQNGVLNCCGYGINAGVYMPPVGCKMIADGCEPIFVLESDETRDCKTGRKLNVKDSPDVVQPIFPGMLPTFPGLMMPDPASMLKNGMNFNSNIFSKNLGTIVPDTTGNSLREYMLSNGLLN